MTLFAGVFDLPWWGYVAVALGLTHVTIAAVTVFLHRHQTHHALDLHPLASHFFRLWLWLTTGMRTREWVAVHRKHHARCETAEDPHSPKIYGINRVLWGGVLLYVKESAKPETIARFGQGTPDDWLERNLYASHVVLGLVLMAIADLVLFGIVPGTLIFLAQIAWIPFWAAGVINGVGHYFGYRNATTEDASTNMAPWGLLIGGEELHNNHHTHPTSAKFSSTWYEFDLGWLYVRLLAALRLATIKRLAPVLRYGVEKPRPDLHTLETLIAHRYQVLKRYDALLRGTDAAALRLIQDMRRELVALWERSLAPREQLVERLQDWCRRAEGSQIASLTAFSRRLRSYA